MSIKAKVVRKSGSGIKPEMIPTRAFQAVSFYDAETKRQLIILYCLGEDGILREYVGGKWNEYPVENIGQRF